MDKEFFKELKSLSVDNDERYLLLMSGIREILANKKPSLRSKKTKSKPKWK